MNLVSTELLSVSPIPGNFCQAAVSNVDMHVTLVRKHDVAASSAIRTGLAYKPNIAYLVISHVDDTKMYT